MAENNTNNNTAGAGNGGEGSENKTFTQDEVNAIVEGRLARERQRYADYDDLKAKAGKYDEIQNEGKTELQKATERADSLQAQLDKLTRENTVRQARAKVSEEMKVPVELLTGDDEETCKKQAEAILKFAKPKSYPGTQRNRSNNNNAGSTDDSMREFAQQIFRRGE